MTTGAVESTSACHAVDPLLDVALMLTASLPSEARYERLLAAVRKVVPCDAAALLRHEDGALVPVAVEGLSSTVLGMRFQPADHPRLASIVDSRRPVRFASDDVRPDPYDGLVLGGTAGGVRVHSCMGASLHVGDSLVGVLTVDALEPTAFDDVDEREFAIFAALAATTMRTAGLIESLEKLAEKRGLVARQLVVEALKRGGGELLGRSLAMRRLEDEIAVVAGSDLTVLVTGETGTGKELVARTLHSRSARADQPLVYVNCAALPESIAESELFGHKKGAFTGAVSDRPGKFEMADGGTLFLDEVGELPLSLQPKLLRALQSGEIQRVGSDGNLIVDVRVIAATNRDLGAAVKEGRFRPDLFHRLSVYPIHVPPLRGREGDVRILASHFLDTVRVKLGLGPMRFSSQALAGLEAYSWPGNVRELEHVVTRSALRASSSGVGGDLEVDAVHLDLHRPDEKREPCPAEPCCQEGPPASLGEAVESFKRNVISRALGESGGNWSEAARRLKVDRGNLYRIGKRLGLV